MDENISRNALYKYSIGAKVDVEELKEAFSQILLQESSSTRDVQLGSLLTSTLANSPTPEHIVGLLDVAFSVDNFSPLHRIRVPLPKEHKLVGAIGSGKKGYKTMNISTPALIVAASKGAYTAKPVSSATSSLTGSADLLESLGVNINASTDHAIQTVQKVGFGAFCIEQLIPNFDAIYGKKIFVPNALSFGLAALASPVEYDNFIYGLAHPNVELSINVLARYNIENAMVASTTDDNVHYLDEMGIYGTTTVKGIRNGKLGQSIHFRPTEELTLPRYTPQDICQGKTLEENVMFCTDVLQGKGETPREDVIAINAGTILYLANLAENLKDGFYQAKSEIATGRPFEKLVQIAEQSNGNSNVTKSFYRGSTQ